MQNEEFHDQINVIFQSPGGQDVPPDSTKILLEDVSKLGSQCRKNK